MSGIAGLLYCKTAWSEFQEIRGNKIEVCQI